MVRVAACVISLSLLLGACTTTGTGGEGAVQPMSAQTATTDARQRAKVHTELGSLYLLDGRHAVALEEARIALSADSSYAPAYNLLGLTHTVLGEPRLAEDNFRRALSLAPGDPEINNNYGWFLCQTGKEKQAMEYFLAAGRNPLYPTPTKPYTNAGMCLIAQKDDKGAEEYLLQALRFDGKNTQALYWLADITYRNERPAEARNFLAEIDKLVEPTAESTWLALRVERKLGNRDVEARYAAHLRRKFANSPEARKLIQGQFE